MKVSAMSEGISYQAKDILIKSLSEFYKDQSKNEKQEPTKEDGFRILSQKPKL